MAASAKNVTSCFTYGSLMCDDIMSGVAGCRLIGEPAFLEGYSRHPVLGEDYPGVVPEVAASVAGILYHDIGAGSWQRLDLFEGGMYERMLVEVVTVPGKRLSAWCYVFRPEYRSRLLAGDWDFDAFLRTGKARFQAGYQGFDVLGH